MAQEQQMLKGAVTGRGETHFIPKQIASLLTHSLCFSISGKLSVNFRKVAKEYEWLFTCNYNIS